jgi:hypothetical protein
MLLVLKKVEENGKYDLYNKGVRFLTAYLEVRI